MSTIPAWKIRQLQQQQENPRKKASEEHQRVCRTFLNAKQKLELIPPLEVSWFPNYTNVDNDFGEPVEFKTETWMPKEEFENFLTEKTKQFQFNYFISKESAEQNLILPSVDYIPFLIQKKLCILPCKDVIISNEMTTKNTILMLTFDEESLFSLLPPEIIEMILFYIPPNPPMVTKYDYSKFELPRTRLPLRYWEVKLSVFIDLDESESLEKITVCFPGSDFERFKQEFKNNSNQLTIMGPGKIPGTINKVCTLEREINNYQTVSETTCNIAVTAYYKDWVVEGIPFVGGEEVSDFVNSICFTGNSSILVLNNVNEWKKINISNLKVGDFVASCDINFPDKIFPSRVNSILLTKWNNLKSIVKLSDECFSTKGHPIYCNDKWYKAKQLKEAKLENIDFLYNFEIENNNCVLVGGMICAPVGLAIDEFEKTGNKNAILFGSKYFSFTRNYIKNNSSNITIFE